MREVLDLSCLRKPQVRGLVPLHTDAPYQMMSMTFKLQCHQTSARAEISITNYFPHN